jgi:hypothetical protein
MHGGVCSLAAVGCLSLLFIKHDLLFSKTKCRAVFLSQAKKKTQRNNRTTICAFDFVRACKNVVCVTHTYRVWVRLAVAVVPEPAQNPAAVQEHAVHLA